MMLFGRVRRWAGRVRSSDGRAASFARFLGVGGAANLVYLGAFWALLSPVGTQAANLVGSITSTVLANELHRRRTFHASGRVRWQTAQWEGGGLAVIGLATTSAALAVADRWLTSPSALVHTLVIATVTGAVGLVRFVLLRSWFTR
jgi:putative flippase GtrA